MKDFGKFTASIMEGNLLLFKERLFMFSLLTGERIIIEEVLVVLYFTPIFYIFVKAFFEEAENIKREMKLEKEKESKKKEE